MATAAPTKKKNKKNWQGLFNTDKAKNDPTGNVGDVLGKVGETAIKQAKRKGGMGPNAREKNDNTRRIHADERNTRIDAKKGDLTEFDKTFLATKGGRKGAPSGDWNHPFETPLESIKRNRMSPEAEKAASKSMPGQTVGDPQEALARGAAAVAAMKALQGPMDAAGDLMPQNVKKNANGTPVAYRNGVPVGFSGKPPSDVVADPMERSMVNKTGLTSPGERSAIQDQIRGVANEEPNTARAAAIAATMKSLGGGAAPAFAPTHVDSEGPGDETGGPEEMNEGQMPQAFASRGMSEPLPNDTPQAYGEMSRKSGMMSNAIPFDVNKLVQGSPEMTQTSQPYHYSLDTFRGSPAGKAVNWLSQLFPQAAMR